MSSNEKKKPKALRFWGALAISGVIALFAALLWALISKGAFTEAAHALWYDTTDPGKLAIVSSIVVVVGGIIYWVKYDNYSTGMHF